MAQELELIIDMLREMKRANNTNSESFDKLLANIGSKLDVIDKNSTSSTLLKAYFGEIAKSVDDKYTTTLNKFSDIEKALKAIFQDQNEHVKNKNIKELFDSFTSSMNNFYTEARQQKVLLSSIETKLAEISNDESDKNDILRTITLLRNDFENLNHGYKSIIDNVNSDLKSILTNLIKSDQTTINSQIKEQVDVLYKATNDIISYLNSIDKRDANLEILLSNVVTNESLKLTQGAIDSIIQKSEEISEKITHLADKPDIEGLQTAASIINQKLDETVTKELFTKISTTTEDLVTSTDEIKKTLADVTQNIETLPNTEKLESSILDLYSKLESLSEDIDNANVSENITDIEKKLEEFNSELTVIKNIIFDLNEVVTSKVMNAINDISFDEEFSDIRNHVSNMISELPQKEDINRLLANEEKNQSAVEDLIKNTDLRVDRLDNLPTHEDMATLNSNQLSLVENLQEVATKDDFEQLASKSDDIEEMIDSLNFDDEFKSIYDKTSNIEDWLKESKIKENAQEIANQIETKAEQKDVLEILNSTNVLVEKLSTISQISNAENMAKTLTDIYSQIEDLKTDFLNTTELHNESAISKLEEIQNKLNYSATSEELANITENLKDFTQTIIIDSKDNAENIEQSKKLQQELIEKIDAIDFSEIHKKLSQNIETLSNYIRVTIDENNEKVQNQVAELDSKLVSLSEYLNSNLTPNNEEIKNSINDIKEIILQNKKSFNEIQDDNFNKTSNIEEYIEELKTILDTSNSGIDENIKAQFLNIEETLAKFNETKDSQISKILEKLDDLTNFADNKNETSSISDIEEIKNQLQELGKSFVDIKSTSEKDVAQFVANKLDELGTNLNTLTANIETGLQSGFSYNSELIEEKTAALLEFIKELRHASTDNIELYERLTVTDNKLMDFQQELELINTDVLSGLNEKTDKMIKELAPIKEMISCLAVQIPDGPQNEKVKEQLGLLHQSVQNDLTECTKYSKTALNKLEETYQRISQDLAQTENNLKDFILGDIDSVIIKIDNLKADLEKIPSRQITPNAEQMQEYNDFVAQIEEFKNEQKEYISDLAKDIKTNINENIQAKHDEIKSMLAVAINNKEIINAINDLKKLFKTKAKQLVENPEEPDSIETDEDFENNEIEKVFEESKNDKIIAEIKEDFSNFTKMISQLSGENSEIISVLNSIKDKIDTITVIKKERELTETDLNEDADIQDFDIDIDDDDSQDIKAESDFEEEAFHNEDETNNGDEIIVGSENFDFLKAFDLLKQDINNLRADIERVLPQQNKSSIPSLGNDNLLLSLNNKIELLAKTLNRNWLEEVKEYIESSDIHSMLEEINSKIDILTLSDNSEWISEIKQALDQLNGNEEAGDSKLHSMLSLISEKIDILAASDNYDLIEDVRDEILDALQNIQPKSDNSEIKDLINSLDAKIDILADTDSTIQLSDLRVAIDSIEDKIDALALAGEDSAEIDDIKTTLKTIENEINKLNSEQAVQGSEYSEIFDTIKDSLDVIEYKIESGETEENIKKLSETDAKITSMLELLNHKIDIISSSEDSLNAAEDIEDVKQLILAQTDYIERFERNSKTDAVKKCLKELTEEVNYLSSNSNTNSKQVQKAMKDMKESIMAAVVTIFEQVSFVEETEDIKDFVEEKTDVINQNLVEVTKQLKQITSSTEDTDYNYSMQDIESDLAKLRLALNELQNNSIESQSSELSNISDTLYKITSSVEELQNSMTQDDIKDLKYDINNGLEGIGKNLTNQISRKVDKVTKLLEKSSDSDKVMRQALIYMGEWIDSASESMNKISTNSDEIVDVKSAIEDLKSSMPEHKEILTSLEEKFDEQQERLSYFEKQISKLGTLEDRFDEQQERIDRLEMTIEKVLSAVEDIDDSRVTRKIDKIDKQLAKLSTNIEKLASYVD
jgi:DNA repair exonuclease SbcCD ATPase subunit